MQEIIDQLFDQLTNLMASPALPSSTAVLQKSYVTYTAPIYESVYSTPSTVVTLESRALLSQSGNTGIQPSITLFIFDPSLIYFGTRFTDLGGSFVLWRILSVRCWESGR